MEFCFLWMMTNDVVLHPFWRDYFFYAALGNLSWNPQDTRAGLVELVRSPDAEAALPSGQNLRLHRVQGEWYQTARLEGLGEKRIPGIPLGFTVVAVRVVIVLVRVLGCHWGLSPDVSKVPPPLLPATWFLVCDLVCDLCSGSRPGSRLPCGQWSFPGFPTVFPGHQPNQSIPRSAKDTVLVLMWMKQSVHVFTFHLLMHTFNQNAHQHWTWCAFFPPKYICTHCICFRNNCLTFPTFTALTGHSMWMLHMYIG